MKILIAPDKFKGSLKAAEAAAAIRDGFYRIFPDAEYDLAPIADGGEGTAEVFRQTLGGDEITVPSHDSLGRPILASYTWLPDTKMAVMEMSAASGLWRLQASELNPLQATTDGTGELMTHARDHGAESILVALGGSATNDAGIGMASALGWKFLDAAENEMTPLPGIFPTIRRMIPPTEKFSCRVTALCDVTNSLLGPKGATRVYGAQKGATPQMMEILETGLAHVADLCRDQLDLDLRDVPGAGATGGLAFGLMTFCAATLEPGFAAVSRLLNLTVRIRSADLIITGEGKLDAQTLHGKGPVEVARLARQNGKRVIAFAGMVEGSLADFDACVPIANGPLAVEESCAQAGNLLRDAAERTARLLRLRF